MGRASRWAGAVLLLAALGTLAHAVLYAFDRSEVEVLRARVEASERDVPESDASWSQAERVVLARLRAADASGAPRCLSPTEVLKSLEEALPDGIAVVGLTLEPFSPSPMLVVEAVAATEGDVSELQRRVSGAPSSGLVSTELLEERLAPDGTRSVRLQIELAPVMEPDGIGVP